MILHGDSLEVLKTLPENSVDAVICDPPYGLSFMGKKWDYDVPDKVLWGHVLRVLKPGGYLLSFGGTRTYHRLVSAIEDAGFEIRDQIQWIYGSGFPKSLDVSKAIDKAAGANREVIGVSANDRPRSQVKGGKAFDRALDEGQEHQTISITAPATPDAIKWQGFGTALKPANEPIVLARKPLSESTVAKNVLKHGCGALNIDGTRIAPQAKDDYGRSASNAEGVRKASGDTFKLGLEPDNGGNESTQGRWPSNLLLDEEAAAMLDEQSGTLKSGDLAPYNNKIDAEFSQFHSKHRDVNRKGDSGGASRFFYVAKASKRERNAGLEGMPEKDPPGSKCSTPAEGRTSALGAPRANHHPTVKPIKLMEYLCKLITPPGGTVLDPFCGSGSTGVAAINLGFKFIGIEREIDYVKIAERRIEHASTKEQLDLEGA